MTNRRTNGGGSVAGRVGDVSGRVGDVSGRVGDVSGRVGDVSGRVGDVSGRLGDVSGRVGDVSGGISGRIGDVSGNSPLTEVKDFLLQDRGDDRFDCLSLRVRRLENEILGIAAWLDQRLIALEAVGPEVDDALRDHERRIEELENLPDQISTLDQKVANHETRIVALESKQPPGT